MKSHRKMRLPISIKCSVGTAGRKKISKCWLPKINTSFQILYLFCPHLLYFWVLTVAISGIACFEWSREVERAYVTCRLCHRASPKATRRRNGEECQHSENFYTFFHGIHQNKEYNWYNKFIDSVSERAPIDWCQRFWGRPYLQPSRSWRSDIRKS